MVPPDRAVAATPSAGFAGADAVARGVVRLFARAECWLLREVTLRNGRRADLMGVTPRGDVVIVEIKCARADLLGDTKWVDYLDYCDRFYWAVPTGFDATPLTREGFAPARTGHIVADAYDADIVRPAALVPLAPARRKVETLRLARLAARRLAWIADPELNRPGAWDGEG